MKRNNEFSRTANEIGMVDDVNSLTSLRISRATFSRHTVNENLLPLSRNL